MPSMTRAELAGYALCAVLVAVFGWRALRSSAAGPARAEPARVEVGGPPRSRVAPSERGSLLVHVVGAVKRPGVYTLRQGDRLRDAVRLAGGATASAALEGVNLASKAADGQQVVVPRKGTAAAAAPAPATSPAGAGSAPQPSAPGQPINVNTATSEELETLDGIGPALAAKIAGGRPYATIDDLAAVPGIGPKRLAAIRTRVTL